MVLDVFMDYVFGIIGLGIMGGSIAKSLKKNVIEPNQEKKIIALDKNIESLKKAKDNQIIDEFYLPENTKDFLSKCDFIFICLYPHATVDFLRQNKNNFKDNAIITDISGVKGLIASEYENIRPQNADLILAHPMAGGEKEGFENSKGEFFINHNYIIIDDKNLSLTKGITVERHKQNLKFFEELIYKMGFSKITKTDCSTHDYKIGFTSQLCHVVAAAMVESAPDKEITSFGGGSFEDLTRIAMINAPLWTELFLSNKEKLLSNICEFKTQLTKIEELIKQENQEELIKLLKDVREKRIEMSSKKS